VYKGQDISSQSSLHRAAAPQWRSSIEVSKGSKSTVSVSAYGSKTPNADQGYLILSNSPGMAYAADQDRLIPGSVSTRPCDRICHSAPSREAYRLTCLGPIGWSEGPKPSACCADIVRRSPTTTASRGEDLQARGCWLTLHATVVVW